MKSGPNVSNPMNNEYRYDPLKKGDIPIMKSVSQESPQTIRGQILDTAKGLTTGSRDKSYGPPIENLTVYAELMEAYVKGRTVVEGGSFDAVDSAIFMVLAKVSRIAMNRGHEDNYVDGAAYMAIAGECDQLLGGE